MSMEDIIAKFPEIFRELARTHIKVLTKLAREELEKWALLMLEGDYEEAQAGLLAQMTTAEAVEDTRAIKEIMRELNRKAKSQNDMWKEFFFRIFVLLIGRLEEEIE